MFEDGLDKSQGANKQLATSQRPGKRAPPGTSVEKRRERWRMWSKNSEAQGVSLAHMCRNCSYSLTCVIFLHRTYVILDFITDLSFYLFISLSLSPENKLLKGRTLYSSPQQHLTHTGNSILLTKLMDERDEPRAEC